MNKNLFSLAVILLMALTKSNAFASTVFNRTTNVLTSTDNNQKTASLPLADNEMWWGLFNGQYEGSDIFDWETSGYGAEITYGCCMKLSADNKYLMGKGKTIEGIKFVFPDLKNIENVRIWMSTQLPTKASAEDADICFMTLDKSTIHDGKTYPNDYVNEVRFDKPYTISDKDVYVGYSFNVTKIEDVYDEAPVVYSDYEDKVIDFKEGFFLRWEDHDWTSMEEDNMVLAIQLLLSGDFEKNNASVVESFDNLISMKGQENNVIVKMMNLGVDGIHDFSYSVLNNGNEIASNDVTLENPITYIGSTTEISIPVIAGNEAIVSDYRVVVNKINGKDNANAQNFADGKVTIIEKQAERKVLIEDYTGTWSGSSPIGIVNLQRSVANFGNQVVPVAVHRSKSDPMTCKDHTLHPSITGVPNALLNRSGDALYPYNGSYSGDDFKFGFGDDIQKAMDKITVADITAEVEMSDDNKLMTVTANTTFHFTGESSNFAITYMLKEDGMYNKEWKQKNYYNAYTDMGYEDVEPFFEPWINGADEIDIEFDNVLIAEIGDMQGVDDSINPNIVSGETQSHSVTFDLSQYPIIQDVNKISACVLLIDRTTGEVMNTDCASVDDIHTGIMDIEKNTVKEVERFSVNGTKIISPTKGVNIVKYSDGTVRKIIVK